MNLQTQEKLLSLAWELQVLYEVWLNSPILWLPAKYGSGLRGLASGEQIPETEFYRTLWDLDKMWMVYRTYPPKDFDYHKLPTQNYGFYQLTSEGRRTLEKLGLVTKEEEQPNQVELAKSWPTTFSTSVSVDDSDIPF